MRRRSVLSVCNERDFLKKIGYLRASWAAGAEGAPGLALEKKKSSTILEGTSEYEE